MAMRFPRLALNPERDRQKFAERSGAPRLVGEPADIIEWPSTIETDMAAGTQDRLKARARAEVRTRRFSGIRDVDESKYSTVVESNDPSPLGLLSELVRICREIDEMREAGMTDDPFVVEIKLTG